MGVAGKLFQTAGISALPLADQSAIREKVETFDAFTLDNDPYGEHDFGAFDHNGKKTTFQSLQAMLDLRDRMKAELAAAAAALGYLIYRLAIWLTSSALPSAAGHITS